MEYKGLEFKIDTDTFPRELLIKICECETYCKFITGLLLRDPRLKKQSMIYLAKMPPGKEYAERSRDGEAVRSGYSQREALNVVSLYNELSGKVTAGGKIPVSAEELSRYNERVFRGLPQTAGAVPGQFRHCCERVGEYRCPHCKDIPALVKRLYGWLESEEFRINQKSGLAENIIKGIIAHVYVMLIHPFRDGNGRSARMLQYAIFRNAGMDSSTAHLSGNFYNETRPEYMRRLRYYDLDGDVVPFLSYAVAGFHDKLCTRLKELSPDRPDIAKLESFIDKNSGPRAFDPDRLQLAASREGFTLIEILIVLAVISILVGTALPRFRGMREEGFITRAKGELNTLQMAVESYFNHNDDTLPTSLNVLTSAVPNIVGSSLPSDPFNSGSNYGYGREGDYYVIYSVGPSGDGSAEIDSEGAVSEADPSNCIYVTNGSPADSQP